MGIVATAKVHSLETPWQGEVSHGKHHYMTDKPASFGGQDGGPATYDFLIAGLISCTMITLRMYAKHKEIELGEFEVEAEFHANREGEEWIERRLHFKTAHEPTLKDKILAICQKTPVTKTLLRSVEIKTSLIE
ncbi:osmotically inducible protein C [Acinetobacter sp. NCu2D-2]|uniref:OsmC family protein n=1 Tax=Acinetobacter sp. NCu2D-2 TaxID=1608473 RepID=UPI0007CE056D|nr:OsmC family protein [Acinetobacter sp. NCu2D-2]ANF82842.1 osmotically inducible protein C [Acinetobacter sp. NCu2D-2]